MSKVNGYDNPSKWSLCDQDVTNLPVYYSCTSVKLLKAYKPTDMGNCSKCSQVIKTLFISYIKPEKVMH